MQKAESFNFAPEISEWHASVLLAQVAATFIAGGASENEAIRRAAELANNCCWALYPNGYHSLVNHEDGITLDAFLTQLSMKSPRSVRKYVFTVISDTAEAKLLWKNALAGKPVFTAKLRAGIKSYRASLIVKRNNNVVASRTATKVVK